ncbi:MAG: HAMP domain-containing histidine kinase [Magnetococcales bacterium]|nr:HAMP domain-containing histidine kinase [Magnetococcales bacterium]NGZ26998.1 HAMP domain-containing histidine kinase [Magnetococcales bacterium]
MSSLQGLYTLSLGTTLLACALLSLLLWQRAGMVAGVYPLIRFLLGTLVGIGGFALVSIPGAPTWLWGERLISLSPVVGVLFIHFTYHFTTGGKPSWIGFAYLLAGGVTLWSWQQGIGSPLYHEGMPATIQLSPSGWLLVVATLLSTLPGHLRLLLSLKNATPLLRRQTLALLAASLWGLVAIAGFFLPSLGFGHFPHLVLLLPGYPILLVYGLLRYRLMAVNIWARQAVIWFLLTIPPIGVGLGVLVLMAAPDESPLSIQVLASQFFTLILALLLVDSMRRWADRLVFPGGYLNRWNPEAWNQRLSQAPDAPTLAATAQQLISQHLNMEVAVYLSPPQPSQETPSSPPAIYCFKQDCHWTHTLQGWQQAPPGPRLAADLFGRLITTAASRLEQTRVAAELARHQEKQAHLAELGVLAATVAHELRNPLNIVAISLVELPNHVQQEIRQQLQRMNRLIGELLDYSKAWHITPRWISLADAVENALTAFPGLVVTREIPESLSLYADPLRLQQVFANLLANAQAALSTQDPPCTGAQVAVSVAIHENYCHLFLCNQGHPIPTELQERIFLPFVSRAEGGTGLGLAIVARIMEAHGGKIGLAQQPGWPTCFELTFPLPPEASP